MELAKLQAECWQIAEDKGFHGLPSSKDIPTRLMLIVSEIAEAMEEYRSGYAPDYVYYHGPKPEGIPMELADAVIRILDLSGQFNINLEAAIREKMAFNKTRPELHGGKKA